MKKALICKIVDKIVIIIGNADLENKDCVRFTGGILMFSPIENDTNMVDLLSIIKDGLFNFDKVDTYSRDVVINKNVIQLETEPGEVWQKVSEDGTIKW